MLDSTQEESIKKLLNRQAPENERRNAGISPPAGCRKSNNGLHPEGGDNPTNAVGSAFMRI